MARISRKVGLALKLIISGRTQVDAARDVGLSPPHLSRALKQALVQQEMQSMQSVLDKEYASLFGRVVEVLREGLNSLDPTIQQNAVRLWFQGSGKQKASVSVTLSAEDVIQKMIASPQVIEHVPDE